MDRFWTEGKALYGGWCSIPDPFLAEVMGASGFDWVCVDMQHGLVAKGDVVGMLQALDRTGTPTIVRVPWNDPAPIMWALDAGAQGVIVPMVNDAQSARAAVAACRYAPDGVRSWGPVRAALLSGADEPSETNRRVLCMVMIETVEAIEHLDEILDVEGIEGVFIGPSDLAVSLGDDPREPPTARHEEAIDTIIATCRDRDVLAGIFCLDVERARRYGEKGYRLLNLQSDARMLRDRATAMLAEVRG